MMSNFYDFWGKTGEKIKNQKSCLPAGRAKIPPTPSPPAGRAGIRWAGKIKELRSILIRKVKPIFRAIKIFFRRLLRLPKVLNHTDKIALLILFLILLGLCGYKFYRDFLSRTKKIPAVGGTYTEVLIGEARYLNPILAKSDTDKTIDRLIYCGLSKIDENGQIVPDLAHDWEISPDNKTYTFHLRSGIFWHDGQEFTSEDVAATIEAIKNENIKSPYYEAWKDVTVEAPDKDTVQFTLKDPYGPFIYNTLVGIIPAHVDLSSISSSPIGTGEYTFSKVISGKNSTIKEVILKRNDDYYGEKPYISEVYFQIAGSEDEAKRQFESRAVNAVAGLKISEEKVMNYSFPTPRYFGLVFNLRDDKFKEEAIRKKLKNGDKFDPAPSFKLLVLDKPLNLSQAEEIKSNFEKNGVKVEIDKKNAIDYQNALQKRNFQAVLYGFDSGYDRDPYEFWHSTQVASGLNFSGFSDKNADILLEDARMSTDATVRNQKYDQFFAILADKVPVIFFPPQNFEFSVKDGLLGISKIVGFEPQDHLNSINSWYIKTKRVKP